MAKTITPVFLTSGLPKTMVKLPRGKWVALSTDGTLVAVADTVKDVVDKAISKGEHAPIVTADISLPTV